MALRSFIVGRSRHADVALSGRHVSTEHLEVTILHSMDGMRRVKLVDLATTNGSFIRRDGKLERFETTFAREDDVLVLGGRECVVGELLREAERRASGGEEARADGKREAFSIHVRKPDGSFHRKS